MKFVQEDYDKYDGVAKDLLADHLIAKGYDILSTEEDFYHDVIAVKDGVDGVDGQDGQDGVRS